MMKKVVFGIIASWYGAHDEVRSWKADAILTGNLDEPNKKSLSNSRLAEAHR